MDGIDLLLTLSCLYNHCFKIKSNKHKIARKKWSYYSLNLAVEIRGQRTPTLFGLGSLLLAVAQLH